MEDTVFAKLSDDVVLNIFFKLEDDPRNWARVACVSTKFSSLIRNVCWRNKCTTSIPSVVSDLLSSATATSPPGGWAALHKLAVCCPGLLHSGVLLENSDFGLERELGPDETFRNSLTFNNNNNTDTNTNNTPQTHEASSSSNSCSWSLFDDLYFDTVYDVPGSTEGTMNPVDAVENSNSVGVGVGVIKVGAEYSVVSKRRKTESTMNPVDAVDNSNSVGVGVVKVGTEYSGVSKRRKKCRSMRSHLASGVWNLSREQGSKLLARQFRDDCLYICDWPGCIHIEDKRNYMLFRGIFKNFKRSRVWRTIKDGNRSRVDLNCAFCECKQTWDLHSAFCLRRFFGYHDDGEPVVRAYVCENGHVSGAWTDWPLYT
nr:phytochrome A-associated F-box protein isoform X2 [Quercus suber]